MPSVETCEAKNNLARLLDPMAEGAQVIITRHGVPVARLLPIEGQPTPDRHASVARLKKLFQGFNCLRG